MDSAGWQELFRSIRPEDQDGLLIWILGGIQVAVHEIARVEDGLVLVRGRIAGKVDPNRLFLLPFDQISAIMVDRLVRLEEAELFSPSVDRERKDEVARQVAELAEDARRKAAREQMAPGEEEAIPLDIKHQLESLRESPRFGGTLTPEPGKGRPMLADADSQESAPTALPAPGSEPDGKRLPIPPRGLPPKFAMPRKPEPPRK